MNSETRNPDPDVLRPEPRTRTAFPRGPSAAIIALTSAVVLVFASPSTATRGASAGALKPLDPPYIDGSFGFSVRPPAGSALYREKQVSDADVEIARFVRLDAQWSFSVRLTTTTRQLDTQTIIDGLTAKLGAQHEEFKVLKGKAARIASREGVRYAASFKAQGMEWIRQQAVVHYQENEYFTLVFITPLSDRGVVESLFDQIVDSFQILRDERARERIQAALDRGTKLLERARTGELDLAAKLIEDSYVRCLLNNQEIGYVRVSERLTTHNHRRGVQVRQWGWLFNPDGSITHLEHDMFLALDLGFERWDNRLYILPSEKSDPNRRVQVTLENGIREADQLGIAYMPKPNAIEKRDKLITVEKSYIPTAWNVLFPRLVDLTKSELYGFSSYNSERHGLVLRTLEVQGSSHVLLDGQQTAAFKIEDSEGLLPPVSQIYVDTSGKMLRVVAEPVEMLATTAKYVDEHYGKKVAEAQDLFKKLQPKIPGPSTPGSPTQRTPSPETPSGIPALQP